MRRRLLNLLTGLSLVLCLAVMVLWVRSYWAQDLLQVRPRLHGPLVVHVFWARGSIACTRTLTVRDEELPLGRRFNFRRGRPDGKPPVDLYGYWQTRDPLFHGAGFAIGRSGPEFGRLGGLLVPLWLPALLFALMPLRRTRAKVRRLSQLRRGLCIRCGYDLRATPDRCPECGEAVTTPA